MGFWEKTVDGLFLENEVFRFKEGGGGLFGEKRKIWKRDMLGLGEMKWDLNCIGKEGKPGFQRVLAWGKDEILGKNNRGAIFREGSIQIQGGGGGCLEIRGKSADILERQETGWGGMKKRWTRASGVPELSLLASGSRDI